VIEQNRRSGLCVKCRIIRKFAIAGRAFCQQVSGLVVARDGFEPDQKG